MPSLTTAATSDADLIHQVSESVGRPRRRPADSFVLHAPLELAARAALLAYCDPRYRDVARERIAEIGARYDAFDEPISEPPNGHFDSPIAAAASLRQGITGGDLERVDGAAAWLGRRVLNTDLPALVADAIVPSLSAAAHGSIFLYQLPRVAPRGELTGELLRPLARELARHPDWNITWPVDVVGPVPPAPPGALAHAIRATPRLSTPGSDFIYPLMSQVQDRGIAHDLLSGAIGTSPNDAARVLLRTAAASMLQEPPDHAPYGWSHCLTMPQAVLGIAHLCADPTFAVAVAATYVVGFRAALGITDLADDWVPRRTTLDVAGAFRGEPGQAVAAVWHADSSTHHQIATELATRACVHPDAHLAKYTLACLDAAAEDRGATRLYLSAAASLVAYWAAKDGVDPLCAA